MVDMGLYTNLQLGGHHIVYFPAENADLSRSREIATWQTTHGLGLHGYETSVSTFNVAMALTILDDPKKRKAYFGFARLIPPLQR